MLVRLRTDPRQEARNQGELQTYPRPTLQGDEEGHSKGRRSLAPHPGRQVGSCSKRELTYTACMDVERLRTFLLTLPHVTETVQWGGSLVLWVGDKAIGGKMFAVLSLNDPVEGRTPQVMAYAAGPARFPDLLEREGLSPAPYLARAHWIAVEDWQVFSHGEWESELRQAHAVILDKLPPRLRTILRMPRTAQRRILHDARQERSRR